MSNVLSTERQRLKELYATLEHWRKRWSTVAELGVDNYTSKNARAERKALAHLEAAQRDYDAHPLNDAVRLLAQLEAAEAERDRLRDALIDLYCDVRAAANYNPDINEMFSSSLRSALKVVAIYYDRSLPDAEQPDAPQA
jgi:hypothetical protein